MVKCCICLVTKKCQYSGKQCKICRKVAICIKCLLNSGNMNLLCSCKYYKKCPVCQVKCMGVDCENITKICKNFMTSHEPFY